MDYLSWFVRDENHILVLEKFIKARKPEVETIATEIRLICVVSEIEERVKNACYVLANPIREEVRALLGHARIDTTQLYARIRPPELKRAVAFYEDQAQRMLVG